MSSTSTSRFGHEMLGAYAQPRLGRSLLEIATSVVPYLALSVLIYLTLDRSLLLSLVLAVPAAGFLVRTFIIFHDCAHGSLFASKRANRYVGRHPGCSCCRRFSAGAMTTRSITQPPATSNGAGSATFHPDSGGVPRAVMAGPFRLPGVTQPARDVRAWADDCDGYRTTYRNARAAAAAAPQRARLPTLRFS